MAITLLDIARKAGVSVSTVSRVLNGQTRKYRINSETAEMVMRTATELQYRPNQLAQGLRSKKSRTVGLIVPDLSNPFFAYLTRSIQIEAHKLGYSLIACNTDENVALEIEHLHLLRSKGVDGLFIMPVGQRYEHLLPLIEEKVPLVLMDRCFESLPISSVVVDNYRGAFNAIEYLIGKGHRRIAVIQGLIGTYTNQGRLKGYRDALRKHGIPVDEQLIVGNDFGRENGYIEAKLLLESGLPPTAFFTLSDLITIGALQAIDEEGCRIPDDISLVAFDDIDVAPFLRCPLTAVAQPKENMGEIAVKLLIDQMKHPEKRQIKRIVLKPRLIIRDSVFKIHPSTQQIHNTTGIVA